MAFNAASINTNKNETKTSLTLNQLNPKELEMLLVLVKKSSFLGEDVETIYNMVVKLQNQYIEQTK